MDFRPWFCSCTWGAVVTAEGQVQGLYDNTGAGEDSKALQKCGNIRSYSLVTKLDLLARFVYYFLHELLLMAMLTGADLLAKLKEMGDASKSDLVRAAGYVSTKKDGGERLNFTAFYEALLEAKGVNLGEGSSRSPKRPGRHLSYATKVQFNGNLMVGKAYTSLLGLEPGDEFEIKIGRHQIQLVPLPEAVQADQALQPQA